MSNTLSMSTISPTEKRNDLHLTSTGIGHLYRMDTATDNVKSIFNQPLPSLYCTPSVHTTYYSTTSASQHKPMRIPDNDIFKKSPSLLKINYTHSTTAKLSAKSWRNPLTMSNQRSEMRDSYQGRSTSPLLTRSQLVDIRLTDHHTNGITKNLKATDTSTTLKGKPFYSEDQAVVHRNQPYMTTSNWFHRPFTYKELTAYPKKDIATYWLCERYPQAWGHGTNESPLPKLAHTDPGPMRDTLTFRSRTRTIPILPEPVQLVSSALQTEYLNSFIDRSNNEIFRPLADPLIIRTEKETSLMASVPNMYKTYNSSYGLTTLT